jgi:Family of unknown function (DUF5317)
VFLLWAIPIGLALGWLLGGRTAGLATLRLRWAALAIAGLVVQVILFTPTGDDLAGEWAPTIYVASTAAVFVAVVRNLRIRGMAVIALGALANLVAIAVNRGAMPADPAALTAAGLVGTAHTNSVVLADPALRPLTDIFAVPAGIPFANVFSLGDVLIGLGIAVVIVAAMRREPTSEPVVSPPAVSPPVVSPPTTSPAAASPDAPAGGSAAGT